MTLLAMSKDELGEHEQVYNLITFLTKFYKDVTIIIVLQGL